MIHRSGVEKDLDAAIARLYETFSSYKLRPRIEGCPCCVGKKRERRLHTHSLRQLTTQDLSSYSQKALTTWGDEYDFKHFLPRIFELCARNQEFDIEIVFGKLAYGGWRSWSFKEQAAIEQYFISAWNEILNSEPRSDEDADSWLCAIAQSVDDLEPYLKLWQQNISLFPVQHLSNLYLANAEDLITKRALSNPFWEERAPQMQQVVAWISSDETFAAFNNALDSSPSDELAHDLVLLVHLGLRPLREAYLFSS